MKVDGKHYRTIWPSKTGQTVEIIDQTRLPFEFKIVELANLDDAVNAIADMLVRGAPLIGATTAWGIWLAMLADGSDTSLKQALDKLRNARPTAVNLSWALAQMSTALKPLKPEDRSAAAYARALEITENDVILCSSIGDHGSQLISDTHAAKGYD